MSEVISRSEAREAAFRVLYSQTITAETLELALDGKRASEPERKFIEKILVTYKENKDDIDAKAALGERIKKVDEALLRLYWTELLIGEVAKPVIVNECVNLAKRYSGDESAGFINGVLRNDK